MRRSSRRCRRSSKRMRRMRRRRVLVRLVVTSSTLLGMEGPYMSSSFGKRRRFGSFGGGRPRPCWVWRGLTWHVNCPGKAADMAM